VSAGEAAYAGGEYLKAVGDYGRALGLLDRKRDRARWQEVRLKRAAAQIAYGQRGEPAAGVKALQEAVAVCREDLGSLDRKAQGTAWADTQNNLGLALWALGEREGGEQGNQRLREAVQAYRLALEVRTRKDLPQDWAATQTNLGNTLQLLAARTTGPGRRKLLEEAAECYSGAGTVFSRATHPPEWKSLGQRLVELALEEGQWDKAAGLARRLTQVAPGAAARVRHTSALLTTGRFKECLGQADRLRKHEQLRDDPDAAAELLVARLICQVALGQQKQAAAGVKELAAHLGKQPAGYRPAGPWVGLSRFLRRTRQERLAANRAWLLKCLGALRRERRDDILRTLEALPDR
jgi:tetratricopeptide (TPR) repeat protein